MTTLEERLRLLLERRRFWGLHASGILFRREDKICLFLRQGTMNDGTWGIPGGKVDQGEHPAESAIREAEEECGPLPQGELFPNPPHVFRLALTEEDVIDGDDEDSPNERRMAKAGEFFTYYTFLFEVEDPDWEPRLNWEHKAARWFHPDEVPENTVTLKDERGEPVYPIRQMLKELIGADL